MICYVINFQAGDDIPDVDRRIDFLCVREGTHLVVVEIKRPHSRIRKKELDQIENYVTFIEGQIRGTSDPDLRYDNVTGYLLGGEVSDDNEVQAKNDTFITDEYLCQAIFRFTRKGRSITC